MASTGPDKRKGGPYLFSSQRKRTKIHDARTLVVQSSDASLSKTGELDVAAFVAARQFEIRALEAGISNSKNAASTRAFQKVPRNLRRRTASHNAKRVPQRLRARAKKEMVEDNTPTVTARRRKPTELLRLRLETARRLQGLNARSRAARRYAKKANANNSRPDGDHGVNIAPRVPKIKQNKLSHPATPISKFRKRQRYKTWLPTHLYHAKRARITEPKSPLWRFAVPITPTEKCYRPTHRAGGARGAIAWDMSYISTIGLEGREASIEGLLRDLGINGQNAWGIKGKKWRNGTRTLDAWALERDGEKRLIAPVRCIWCPMEEQADVDMLAMETIHNLAKSKKAQPPLRRMFIRVHPSAFLQLWEEILRVAKIQKPRVVVEDLRFEIGSIEVTGPGATEALLGALVPVLPEGVSEWPEDSVENIWQSLTGLTNAASLPRNSLLAFDISDPRLRFPPRPLKNDPKIGDNSTRLADTLASWPPDSTQSVPSLFSRMARLKASRLLPSQKALNRRKSQATPGANLPTLAHDPRIPVLLYTTGGRNPSNSSNNQGTWTILLPWKCVVPVWYYTLYFPLSSGGNPRFGGLQEHQQLAFESGTPWFPGDFPGTKAGWTWETRQRRQQREEWERKPKGKRIEYGTIDLGTGKAGEIGHGWACDWERLISGVDSEDRKKSDKKSKNSNKKFKRKSGSKVKTKRKAKPSETEDSLKEKESKSVHPPLEIQQLEPSIASLVLSQKEKSSEITPPIQLCLRKPALATIQVTLFSRGIPTPRSRIYRLPASDHVLRSQWLSLLDQPVNDNVGNESPKHPPLPPESDLIGFITTGSFNLAAGKGTGVGAILLERVSLYSPPTDCNVPAPGMREQRISKEKLMRTCIVRAAGEKIGRLGRWEAVG
ncbi:hypothetical protein FQN57_000799 [Myotisia sp. PD_48]|nr:hypothetical protein FQN57_000799 [Myotisia sp. PD_48]